MAKRIRTADVALEDKEQQYGNMEEAATIACTSRKYLEIWCGDHRQTPSGLQQTNEAKRFRPTVTVDSSVSSSESESSVGASNCDSVLEALDVWYTKLQPLGGELHHEELPDARELRLLPDAWPLARLTFPLAQRQEC